MVDAPRKWLAAPAAGRGGSVLVPVVAAMVILLLAGFALTEISGAQRLRSTIALDSAKAYWIAEAGIHHAAYLQAAIASPVSFAGGTYAVALSSDTYTATGTWGGAKRVASETLEGYSPLDEAASEATADNPGSKEFTLDLVSISPVDIELASFSLSASASTPKLKLLKLAGNEIWIEGSGANLPTGVRAMNSGTSALRTIDAGDSPELFLEHYSDASGTITYTLVLTFTDASSSTLVFTISW